MLEETSDSVWLERLVANEGGQASFPIEHPHHRRVRDRRLTACVQQMLIGHRKGESHRLECLLLAPWDEKALETVGFHTHCVIRSGVSRFGSTVIARCCTGCRPSDRSYRCAATSFWSLSRPVCRKAVSTNVATVMRPARSSRRTACLSGWRG